LLLLAAVSERWREQWAALIFLLVIALAMVALIPYHWDHFSPLLM
jgi:hypothetical protein